MILKSISCFFSTTICQTHKRNLFRKGDCLLDCTTEVDPRPNKNRNIWVVSYYTFFFLFKENICVGYFPKNCQSDCYRNVLDGLMIYFSSSENTVFIALERIGNCYFDSIPQKNTMSQNIVQNKNNILVNGSFILHLFLKQQCGFKVAFE